MRLFCNQTNLVYTDPVIDKITQAPVTTAVVTANLYDSSDTLVPSSNITLPHINGGVYRAVMPVLAVVDKNTYQIELLVKISGVTVWYFKGPIKAIIRTQNDV